ncbi:hypothetical protein V6N13_088239 [Hibiscus sabdariffa]|uniref:Uncharacterized protein n=1 Tax=Hibiscus sabdariffa TaxID=183260 RepID=A0ABR2FYP6_9ROSI
MASAGMKMIMMVILMSMVGHMVSAGRLADCMRECIKSCDSGFMCILKCEWDCTLSTGGGFIGYLSSKKVAIATPGCSAFPTSSPCSSPNPDGSDKKRKPMVN